MARNDASNAGRAWMKLTYDFFAPRETVQHFTIAVSVTRRVTSSSGTPSATNPLIFVVRSLLSHCQHPRERARLVSRLFAVLTAIARPHHDALDYFRASMTSFVSVRQEAQETVSRRIADVVVAASIYIGGAKPTAEEVGRSMTAIGTAILSDCFAVPESASYVKAALEKIKHEGVEQDECAICLEEFEAGEEVAVTPCSHGFHGRCVSNWIGVRAACPICRASLPPLPNSPVYVFTYVFFL